MALLISDSLSGVALGPPSALSAFANKRAVLVLPRATRPNKQIGMRDALGIDRIAQGAHDMILPHEFVELLRAPAAGDNLIAFFHRDLKKSSDLGEVARGFFKNFALFKNQGKSGSTKHRLIVHPYVRTQKWPGTLRHMRIRCPLLPSGSDGVNLSNIA